MKVCITGASSTVARKLIEVLEKDHELTLADVNYPANFTPLEAKCRAACRGDERSANRVANTGFNIPGELLTGFTSKSRRLTGSVFDRKFVKDALRGQDAVVHMAIANGSAKRSDEEMWKVNVEGTFVVLQEAVAAGVKKFIYASSLSVFDSYGDLTKPLGITEETEPKPKSFYGLTKYLGEIMAKFHAENSKMKAVVLRLIAVVPEPPLTSWANKVSPKIQTSARDVANAFKLALEKELKSNFEIFHISGAHPQSPWSNEKAKRLLGYSPK